MTARIFNEQKERKPRIPIPLLRLAVLQPLLNYGTRKRSRRTTRGDLLDSLRKREMGRRVYRTVSPAIRTTYQFYVLQRIFLANQKMLIIFSDLLLYRKSTNPIPSFENRARVSFRGGEYCSEIGLYAG